MSGKDILPTTDADFNILQEGFMKAVVANTSAWQIPAGELAPLTTAQTRWTNAWQITRNKMNCTTAQREEKTLARKAYSKVLRPFIQRWIYRNENVKSNDVVLCGLKPRTKAVRSVHLPEIPKNFKLTRGETGELVATCKRMSGVEGYGCILSEGVPLPKGFHFNEYGQLHLKHGTAAAVIIDGNKSRKKKFTGLKPGTEYYAYFYTTNTRGISPLSDPQNIKCW